MKYIKELLEPVLSKVDPVIFRYGGSHAQNSCRDISLKFDATMSYCELSLHLLSDNKYSVQPSSLNHLEFSSIVARKKFNDLVFSYLTTFSGNWSDSDMNWVKEVVFGKVTFASQYIPFHNRNGEWVRTNGFEKIPIPAASSLFNVCYECKTGKRDLVVSRYITKAVCPKCKQERNILLDSKEIHLEQYNF